MVVMIAAVAVKALCAEQWRSSSTTGKSELAGDREENKRGTVVLMTGSEFT